MGAGGSTMGDVANGCWTPTVATDGETHVFCNPATGREYSEDDFHRWIDVKFAAAGMSAFDLATHCFRIGGVPTLAVVGGVAAAGGMGRWHGQAMALYVHLTRTQRARWMVEMASATELSFEELSRPRWAAPPVTTMRDDGALGETHEADDRLRRTARAVGARGEGEGRGWIVAGRGWVVVWRGWV